MLHRMYIIRQGMIVCMSADVVGEQCQEPSTQLSLATECQCGSPVSVMILECQDSASLSPDILPNRANL